MNYKVSSRERVLLIVLAVLIIAVLWFVFVYQGTTSQITSLDNEIAMVQDELVAAQAKQVRLNEMEASIEQRQSSNVQLVEVPKYDNVKNVMNELNRVLGSAASYSLAFDQLQFEDDGTVRRGANITFNTYTRNQAETIVSSLAAGPYPCAVDTLYIDDRSANVPVAANVNAGSSTGETAANVAAQNNEGQATNAAQGASADGAAADAADAQAQPAQPQTADIASSIHVTYFERQ